MKTARLNTSMVLSSHPQILWSRCMLQRETWTTNASRLYAVAEVDVPGDQLLPLLAHQRLSPTVYRDCPRRRLHQTTASHKWLHVLTNLGLALWYVNGRRRRVTHSLQSLRKKSADHRQRPLHQPNHQRRDESPSLTLSFAKSLLPTLPLSV